jgi:hypothetical protein
MSAIACRYSLARPVEEKTARRGGGVPYEFLSFHVEPRDFLDGTPTGLYSATPPSP